MNTYLRLLFGSILFSIILSHPTFGQPDTDIFLVSITQKTLRVGKPVNITQRKGYDNQPSFTPDGSGLLYTSLREDGQTDIYRYDISSKVTSPLTHTPESEYSPTVTPDPAFFSVIRVEADKTQRLWQFPLSGSGEPTLVLPQVKPVGYHCWLSSDWLALFILGQPASLQLAHANKADTMRIDQPIGRTLLLIPGQDALSYVHKSAPTVWTIKRVHLPSMEFSTITSTLEGSEDFVWTPDGSLLMGSGTSIYKYKPETDATWTLLADFKSLGVKQITRLAIDKQGKKLAFVAQ